MAAHPPMALIACDWGTTNLRLWALAADGTVAAFLESDEGMNRLAREAFAPVFERLAEQAGAGATVPAIVCGMAGARQGWHEAGYRPLPCALDSLAGNAVRVPGLRRDVRILPGIARHDADRPDVMRSEETQLLGLHPGLADSLVCMPGTHTKWVRVSAGAVTDFMTAMTGELHALLAGQSILRHTLEGCSPDPASPAFAAAAQAALEKPGAAMSRLFALRAGRLLNGLSAQESADRLSGLLVGMDVAASCAAMAQGAGAVTLVGGSGSRAAAAYRRVLDLAGLTVDEADAHEASRNGLVRAAGALWPGIVEAVTDRHARLCNN